MPAAADADPSWALPHESAESGLGAAELARHVRTRLAPASRLLFRAPTDAPEGWRLTGRESIVHEASGLECPYAVSLPEENRRFALVDIRTLDSARLDISCVYSTGMGAALTLNASFWPQLSLDAAAAGAVAAIKMSHGGKEQLATSVAAPREAEPEPLADGAGLVRAGAFALGAIDRTPYKTSLWMAKTHGWHVKARAAYPADDISSELVAAALFSIALDNVRAKNAREPLSGAEL